jgi:hypothetical protein
MNVYNVNLVIISIIKLVFRMEVAPQKHSNQIQLVKNVMNSA